MSENTTGLQPDVGIPRLEVPKPQAAGSFKHFEKFEEQLPFTGITSLPHPVGSDETNPKSLHRTFRKTTKKGVGAIRYCLWDSCVLGVQSSRSAFHMLQQLLRGVANFPLEGPWVLWAKWDRNKTLCILPSSRIVKIPYDRYVVPRLGVLTLPQMIFNLSEDPQSRKPDQQ